MNFGKIEILAKYLVLTNIFICGLKNFYGKNRLHFILKNHDMKHKNLK